MEIQYKDALKTLYYTIPLSAINTLQLLVRTELTPIKYIGIVLTFFILPTLLVAYIMSLIVKKFLEKHQNIKKWKHAGIKSLKYSVPFIAFILSASSFLSLGFSSVHSLVIPFFIVFIISIVIFALPIALISSTISYFKNK